MISDQAELIHILVTTSIHWMNLSITRSDTFSRDISGMKQSFCFIPTTQLLVIRWAPTTFPFLPLYGSDLIGLITVPHYQKWRYLGQVCANINASY